MAEETTLISTWYQHFEGANQSVTEFYDMVQAAVTRRKIPDVKFSRISLKEGGMFSASREYLRISRGDLRYDICGAPFGNGFFVSSRLISEYRFDDNLLGSLERGGALGKIASGITAKAIGADTYMKVDSARMFLELAHRGLMDAVDIVIGSAGLLPLREMDRRPVLKGFFA